MSDGKLGQALSVLLLERDRRAKRVAELLKQGREKRLDIPTHQAIRHEVADHERFIDAVTVITEALTNLIDRLPPNAHEP